MKRFNAFSDRHPLLSILVGFMALVAIVLVCVPADGPVEQPTQRSAT